MHYVVDRFNRIVDVDAAWDAAVSGDSGCPGVMRVRIIGRPLESFLAGDATKMFVRVAFDAVRLLGEPRVLPYRCDSTTERRRFEMTISAADGGLIRVTHRQVFAEPRLARSAISKARASAGWRCSQCMAVRLVGTREWVDAEGYTPLAQDVCPRCAGNLFEFSRAVVE
jgi:hypothetical protein